MLKVYFYHTLDHRNIEKRKEDDSPVRASTIITLSQRKSKEITASDTTLFTSDTEKKNQ